MALDSFVGDSLTDSPYKEVCKMYNDLMKQHTELLDKYAVLVREFVELNNGISRLEDK